MDSLGNLLFYTNGWEVADSTGYIMLNGANISTTTYQSTIFPQVLAWMYHKQIWHTLPK
ncbi:MAG: hypothetical protein IPP29_03765 [Bacteroidetes bacterium]|nr:hypothetical protein [Bacteroidota bacterium]